MSAPGLSVYTIDAGIPFVDALARGLQLRISRDHGDDPLALARVTVLLPTRRAVRSLAEAFLRASGGTPLLLPRMMPLGDLDEDELLITGEAAGPAADGTGTEAAQPLAPVIGGLRRQLILARLVMTFGGRTWPTPPDAGQAAELASALARLLDQMETERLGFEGLADLVPERFSEHWQATLEFLKIVTEFWPRELAEEGAIGPAERRNRLLAAHGAAWTAAPPRDWVVAAGSTGSIPATADLLAVIARADRGAVVLPGLDAALTDRAWDALPESHPQYGFARLLALLGMARQEVLSFAADWPHGVEPAAPQLRAQVLSGAMNPLPQGQPQGTGAALAGVGLASCPTSSDEAATIALRMRGALEEPGATAALVTPDRGLARRVAARLGHWGIEVDDSAGTPLAATAAGSFFRLIADMVGDGFAPLAVLACLKHPLAAGGTDQASFRGAVRALETHVLRGPRPGPGLHGLRQRIEAALELAGEEDQEELERLGSWTRSIAQLMAPLAAAMTGPDIALGDIVRAHVGAAEALAATDGESGAARLWRGDDGEALAEFAAEILDAGASMPPLPGARYQALLGALMAGRVVRPGWGRHPRLFIWGPLEARLQHADVMILGGLNEGTWPADAGADPWMSRPMRAALGLPLAERRIGLAAHDFAQAFSAPEVLLTRAQRENGTPTVPSRWLARLENALPGAEFAALEARGEAWRRAAAQRDEPAGGGGAALARPAPKPPLAARPRRLSVSEIATLQTNPYAIYAKRILRLRRLDDIDADAGAAERGIFTHRALQIFLDHWPDKLPGGGADAITEAIIEIGREVFRPVAATPGLYAFWWPRFKRIARWVAETEIDRRPGLLPLGAECRGEMVIEAPGGLFTLNGIADRVDRRAADHGLAIVDYKTGGLPSGKDQSTGFAPQLPLLAAMATAGGLEGIAPGPVMELAYWRLTGGDPVGESKAFAVPAAEAAEAALEGLGALIAQFDDPGWPYRPRPVAGHEPRFDDYAHLARVSEWSILETGGEDGEG